MKQIFMIIFFLFFTVSSFAEDAALKENKNISLVKEMFSQFAEKRDIDKLDTYYTKNFVLESNGKRYDYSTYKNLEKNIFQTLKSLKVTRYDDIFAAGNKVVSRMSIKLIPQKGKPHEFKVILIALIKNNKIDRIWEITYPSWSDKLSK